MIILDLCGHIKEDLAKRYHGYRLEHSASQLAFCQSILYYYYYYCYYSKGSVEIGFFSPSMCILGFPYPRCFPTRIVRPCGT